MNRIDRVVSVCTIKDIGSWTVASPRIVKHISASQYVVVVPNQFCKDFVKASDPAFQIHPEEDYVSRSDFRFIASSLRANSLTSKMSPNWFYQQFLKLEASRSRDNKKILIWDADTLPLRDLNFFNVDGTINLFIGDEFHLPYFALISEILGSGRLVNGSFIAQCLPFYSDVLQRLIAIIQKRYGMNWIRGLMTVVADLSSRRIHCSFSEYELLGTFMCLDHPEGLIARAYGSNEWSRSGTKLFGSARNLEIFSRHPVILDSYFVAFEQSMAPLIRYVQPRVSFLSRFKTISRGLQSVRWDSDFAGATEIVYGSHLKSFLDDFSRFSSGTDVAIVKSTRDVDRIFWNSFKKDYLSGNFSRMVDLSVCDLQKVLNGTAFDMVVFADFLAFVASLRCLVRSPRPSLFICIRSPRFLAWVAQAICAIWLKRNGYKFVAGYRANLWAFLG